MPLEIGAEASTLVAWAAPAAHYEAVGVDPEAPIEGDYRRVEFEQVELFKDVDVPYSFLDLAQTSERTNWRRPRRGSEMR